jgi:hypothetical protein
MNAASQPSRKWWATQVTALGGLITAWVVADSWNKQLTVATITLVGQAIAGYLVPNAPDARSPEREPAGLADEQPVERRVGPRPGHFGHARAREKSDAARR